MRGKLRVEFRSLETDTQFASEFRGQQVATLAAGAQGKAWYFIELFYHQQKSSFKAYATESYLEGLARRASGLLNLARWNEDRRGSALARQVASDQRAAAKRRLVPATGVSDPAYPGAVDPDSVVLAAGTIRLRRGDRKGAGAGNAQQYSACLIHDSFTRKSPSPEGGSASGRPITTAP